MTTAEECAQRTITAGQVYQHFKGGYYRILATALDTTDEITVVVVYQSLSDGAIYVRRQTEFLDWIDRPATVATPGYLGPRFKGPALGAGYSTGPEWLRRVVIDITLLVAFLEAKQASAALNARTQQDRGQTGKANRWIGVQEVLGDLIRILKIEQQTPGYLAAVHSFEHQELPHAQQPE